MPSGASALALLAAASCFLAGCGSDEEKGSSGNSDPVPLAAADARSKDCRSWDSHREGSNLVLRPGNRADASGYNDAVCKVKGSPNTYRIAFVPLTRGNCGDYVDSSVTVPHRFGTRVERPIFRVESTNPETRRTGRCLGLGLVVYEPSAIYYLHTDDPDSIRVVYVRP